MYTPANIPIDGEVTALREHLQRELEKISGAFQLIQQGRMLSPTSVAPAKPRDGQIQVADGVNWDPAVGEGVYVWLPNDADGPQWIQLLKNGGRGGFGWDDEVGDVSLVNAVNDPKSLTFIGGIKVVAFENHATAPTEDAISSFVHVRHSYAAGTKFYPHVHWATTADSGTVRWGFEFTVAKGHGQQAFGATTTVYVEQATAGAYYHMVAEVSEADAIPVANLEPDSLILMRIFRNSSHVNDTLAGNAFMFKVDCHFQVGDQYGTKNKAPNFYTG